MKNICVIDDCRAVGEMFSWGLGDGYKVTHLLRLPEDVKELAEYDLLIVDNKGIWNSKFKNGVEFLKWYIPEHSNQAFIHYTGWCNSENREALESIGCDIVESVGQFDFIKSIVEKKLSVAKDK